METHAHPLRGSSSHAVHRTVLAIPFVIIVVVVIIIIIIVRGDRRSDDDARWRFWHRR